MSAAASEVGKSLPREPGIEPRRRNVKVEPKEEESEAEREAAEASRPRRILRGSFFRDLGAAVLTTTNPFVDSATSKIKRAAVTNRIAAAFAGVSQKTVAERLFRRKGKEEA